MLWLVGSLQQAYVCIIRTCGEFLTSFIIAYTAPHMLLVHESLGRGTFGIMGDAKSDVYNSKIWFMGQR